MLPARRYDCHHHGFFLRRLHIDAMQRRGVDVDNAARVDAAIAAAAFLREWQKRVCCACEAEEAQCSVRFVVYRFVILFFVDAIVALFRSIERLRDRLLRMARKNDAADAMLMLLLLLPC